MILAWLLAVTACGGPPPADATGEEIYQQMCANCHGEALNGGVGPPLGDGSNAAAQDDEFLALTITRGRGRMPSFATTLAEDQIARVVDHIRAEQLAEDSG